MSNQPNTKKFYSLVTKFSKNKGEEVNIIEEMNTCNIKAQWVEESEKALLENRLSDPTNPLQFDDLLQAVYTARGEKVLRIMMTDIKALSDAEKELRRTYRKQAPAYLKSIKKQLNDLQSPKDAVARKVKTLREYIEEEVGKIEKRIASTEAPDIKSVKATVDALAALRATL